jgi:SAM-dependent methyltransferase
MLKGKLTQIKSRCTSLLKKFQLICKYGFQKYKGAVDKLPLFIDIDKPYVFTSSLCRQQHFRMPLYTYWCKKLDESPRFHRKQWEFVFICHVLYERGYLKSGIDAIGFGVGKEPLVSLFASYGINVLATDLEIERAKSLGWVSTNQHSNNLSDLNKKSLCEDNLFKEKVRFQNVDMNNIPDDLGKFDFCWSSCAFEHLGSIKNGLEFVSNSLKLLKPGGIAVHTTEFNVSSNDKTLDNNPSFVIYRRRDFEDFTEKLTRDGFIVETIDYSVGEDKLERYVDLPPYSNEPHLRLQLANEFVSTSIGLIIRVPN